MAAYALAASSKADRVRRQRLQRQRPEQGDGLGLPATAVPARRQPGRDRRDLRAADRQPSPVEGAAERQASRRASRTTTPPAPCPRGRAAPARRASTAGLPDDLDHQRHPVRAARIRHRRGHVVGSDGGRRRPVATSRRHASGSTAMTRAPARCSSSTVSRPTTPRPKTTTVSPSTWPGVERDLQRRLDHRQQRRRAGVDGRRVARRPRRRARSGPGGDGRRRRDRRRASVGPALLDMSDAAVAVAERVAERAAEGADRLVEGHVGVELATVRKHLGAGADAGARRADEHLAVARAAGSASSRISTWRGATNHTLRPPRIGAVCPTPRRG